MQSFQSRHGAVSLGDSNLSRNFASQWCVVLSALFACASVSAAELAALRAAASSITSDELKSHVDVLADDSFEGREAGTRGGHAAGGYLVKQLQSRSLKPAGENGTYFQTFGNGYRNVLGMIEGSDPDLKQEVIVVAAHYDHVGYGSRSNSYGPWGYIHNGADDNASGLSGLLEAIDALLAMKPAPKRSLLFAFFDGEEKGLLGSKQWIADPSLSLKRVVFMINIDMIGRMQNERIELYGSRSARGLRRLVSESNSLTGLKLDFNWEMKENSDHYPFFAQRIPTLMMHTGLHSDYHRPSDDANRLNLVGMQSAAQFLFATAYELATRPEAYAFRPEAFNEYPSLKESLEQPLPHSQPRLGVIWKKNESDQPGLVVEEITPNSPAHRADLRPGDRLLRFANKPVLDAQEFRSDVLMAASPVEVTLERPGAEKPIDLKIELAGSPTRIGISWREDAAEPGTVLLTQVVFGSPAYTAGLTNRDRIYSVGGQPFRTSNELHKLLTTSPSPMELVVERDGQVRTVALVLPSVGGG
jgi:hypothetical protein